MADEPPAEVTEPEVTETEVKDAAVDAAPPTRQIDDDDDDSLVGSHSRILTTVASTTSDVNYVDFLEELEKEKKLTDPSCLKYHQTSLFSQVFAIDDGTHEVVLEVQEPEEQVPVTRKILKSPAALYDALASPKRKLLEKLYTIKKPKEDYRRYIRKADSDTQTDSCSCTCSSDEPMLLERKKLEYLMGLQPSDEAAPPEHKPDLEEVIYEESLDEPLTGTTEAMRRAQKYLRTHKIFQYYQFLITHLLSATPENPIDFLTDLMDRCLIYRGGFCAPPLLYEEKHIDCLFNLMDPMRTGFIDYEQYKTGMTTLGICSYNDKPPFDADGMIAKDFFVKEAYENLTNQLNDMLRKRWVRVVPSPIMRTPPPSMVTSLENATLTTAESHLKHCVVQDKGVDDAL